LLDQKSREQARQPAQVRDEYKLPAEVGAWTAAIDACGKSGSIDTAVKLFYSMPKYGVHPNTITCGSLVDCLLRNGRTSDSLDVLRYMKKNRITPSEVMYTSLITSASKLAEYENQVLGGDDEVDQDATTAVEVYAELMASVAQAPKAKMDQQHDKKKADPSELFRVSLVFQEMKSAGVEPDLACYNAILKACAKGGDVDKAVDVLDQINASEELEPNEQTWNSVIRAAGKAGRSDVALWAWKNAVEDVLDNDGEPRNSSYRHLSSRSLGALVSALVQNAEDVDIDRNTEVRLYQLVVKIWESILSQSEFLGMHLVKRNRIYENKQIMGIFLHSVVSLENFVAAEHENAKIDKEKLRNSAVSMIKFNCFEGGLSKLRRNVPVATAFEAAQRWANEGQS
jgi:pentatricopeptide repeat protein